MPFGINAVQIDPNSAVITIDTGADGDFDMFIFNPVTGVVTSTYVPANMAAWVQTKLQKLIAISPTVAAAVAAFPQGFMSSLFTLGNTSLTAPTISIVAVGSGRFGVNVTGYSDGDALILALQHSISPSASLDQVSGAGGGGGGPFLPLSGGTVSGPVVFDGLTTIFEAQLPQGFFVPTNSYDNTTGTPGDAEFSFFLGRSAIALGQQTCLMSGILPANSFVIPWLESADATLTSISAQPSVDSFLVTGNAPASADCNFGWMIIVVAG